jgi:SPP1 gp7 family putative phage head morphogenesis protein
MFRPISEVLSDGLIASYLMGLDHAREAAKLEKQKAKSILQFQDPVQTAFNVPPKEAIDYFKAKKVVRKKVFDKLSREAKSASFTVGGVYREDVLSGFKEELRDALEKGRTQLQTINRFHKILAGAGHKQLGDFHLETVFRTNMQTAYGVGRRQALEELKDDLPFWQYHAVMDDRTRPAHATLNGMIQSADSPFWDTHFPPWGFNCRCSITATSALPADYDLRNPSGALDEHGEPLVHLSYDGNGMPAKAEYGTSLYDLQVGNFAGVPRQATLLNAVEAGVKRAEQSSRNSRD